MLAHVSGLALENRHFELMLSLVTDLIEATIDVPKTSSFEGQVCPNWDFGTMGEK